MENLKLMPSAEYSPAIHGDLLAACPVDESQEHVFSLGNGIVAHIKRAADESVDFNLINQASSEIPGQPDLVRGMVKGNDFIVQTSRLDQSARFTTSSDELSAIADAINLTAPMSPDEYEHYLLYPEFTATHAVVGGLNVEAVLGLFEYFKTDD